MLIDSDVIIRYLTGDDAKKADRFEKFLASGKKATITDVTIAGVYWTLSSFYKFPKLQILDALMAHTSFPHLITNTAIIGRTIQMLKETNTSFIDAYLVASAQMSDDREILSFDKGFDRIKGVKRIEP